MKTNHFLLSMVLTTIFSLNLASCEKKENRVDEVDLGLRNSRNRLVNFDTTTNGWGLGSSYQPIWITVQFSGDHRWFLENLLLASMRKEDFGDIHGARVMIRLDYTFDGRLASSSAIRLHVNDSFEGQKRDGKIIGPIMIAPAPSSGTYNSLTRVFTAVFKDSFGSIRVSGKTGSSTVRVSLSYENNNSISGDGSFFDVDINNLFGDWSAFLL